jgi:hypothetical protein
MTGTANWKCPRAANALGISPAEGPSVEQEGRSVSGGY